MNVLFTDVAEFKHQLLQDDVNDVRDGEEITFGYLQPGHVIKGH